ncbi:MAG: methylmalonyl Co-A mutase-associated GTPase MeaB [Flavobacteriaceae bacterium]|nr:methylmalonyl Co-A mutase-associated GTPase MeaB [Flavobacteriaceae bacterium]
MTNNPIIQEYFSKITAGNMPALSKAITLVESNLPKHQEMAEELVKICLPYSGKSIRIGITGVPGVGKSTFIEAFGNILTQAGKKVAVLAVDPSSSVNKGSILGDKTRMETLVQNPNVFIRPSASGDNLGGVAKKTRESILLCEAAGFDVILVETVGVGQSETAVHSMVDFFLLLQLAGAGDELQGIKRGIMEMCDAIIINKADGDNVKWAQLAKQNYENALHLYAEKINNWQPKVLTCSAIEKTGIENIWDMIQSYVLLTQSNQSFDDKRNNQEEYWMFETLNQALKDRFYQNEKVQIELKKQLQLLNEKKTTPYEVASLLWSKAFEP